ncbi:xanthine dehydrogenase small subunit [Aestuariivirga litoralis]|uniref:xanthine dehydrogenase small subunit n=1 Tax=Aestuariivirga litoralis TaxID=2650924 RepID=UPI0018C5B7B9|nr:xanthine dehydrogenase small subunit [Aestuariivirga litoralis]MBG1232632.1 xanthine dehydrogenase small subunit [Aestuariivirga litoralis]
MALSFLRRGKMVQVENFVPDTMLLDYLRLTERSRGTKEGCNEGDCGACTVVLGDLVNGSVQYKAVNACILFLGQIHGKELITVEDLAEGGKLHPVQAAMVETHGSQCGFCTPGFVMSLFALGHQKQNVSRDDILLAIAGNLCRCTGYKPIVDAGLKACNKLSDKFSADAKQAAAALQSIANEDLFIGNEDSFFAAPASGAALATLAAKYPQARIVAGATDIGLWVTKLMRPQKQIIYTGRATDFAEVKVSGDGISVGAGATYTAALNALSSHAADFGSVVRRIGSTQVRNSGTIGGNVANGSPIGDTPPMLIALGATLTLRNGEATRAMPIEDYFIAYGKQDRVPGELVWQIDVPKLKANQQFKAYKISKRFDQDISAVMAAFRFTLDGDVISEARIAFGGMAATPKRATKTEDALRGKTLAQALSITLDDYAPLTDMRASAEYRRETAAALLKKALLELQGETQTRVLVA